MKNLILAFLACLAMQAYAEEPPAETPSEQPSAASELNELGVALGSLLRDFETFAHQVVQSMEGREPQAARPAGEERSVELAAPSSEPQGGYLSILNQYSGLFSIIGALFGVTFGLIAKFLIDRHAYIRARNHEVETLKAALCGELEALETATRRIFEALQGRIDDSKPVRVRSELPTMVWESSVSRIGLLEKSVAQQLVRTYYKIRSYEPDVNLLSLKDEASPPGIIVIDPKRLGEYEQAITTTQRAILVALEKLGVNKQT